MERVWAFPDTGLVVVAGTADAEVLRRRIQHKMRRVVTVVSDGTGDHRYGTTQHPRYYTWATTTSHPQPVAYPYGGNYYRAAYPRRHVSNSNGTPTYLDDEIPDEYCCSIQ